MIGVHSIWNQRSRRGFWKLPGWGTDWDARRYRCRQEIPSPIKISIRVDSCWYKYPNRWARMISNGGVCCKLHRSSRRLVSRLRVFGAIPSLAQTMPGPWQLERARVLVYAMDTIAKEQARRKIVHDLKYTKGKKGLELSEELRHLPAGSLVLVYRTNGNKWKLPYKFIHIDGETVVLHVNDKERCSDLCALKQSQNV